jgi:23S rRNA (cytosine1962-C5)-methyltransferase
VADKIYCTDRRECNILNHSELNVLYLKRREEHRLRNGHPWVFSNEVDTKKSPMSSFEPGQVVEVRASAERLLGVAQINPKALICARLISRASPAELPADWLERRLQRALLIREQLFEQPYYRLAYAESDGLPGVIVDRYGDVLAVQLNTVAADNAVERICDALQAMLAPRAIVLRNDSPARALEGLTEYSDVAHGQLDGPVQITENGCRFWVDPIGGQKTGWYYDQRSNRAQAAATAKRTRVLDLFSYSGGWGVQCAANGADEVLCVDSSAPALAAVMENAELNGVSAKVRTQQGDVFKVLRELRSAQERFDRIIADPPAFIRRKKDTKAGIEAYRRLNLMAMQLLTDEGMLVSASCSSHLSDADLRDCVRSAAVKVGRTAQILVLGHQGPDHPMLPGMPESRYIKSVTSSLLKG